MPDTPPDGAPRGADEAMGPAPAVEVADRDRIRAGARAKLFGEPPPKPAAPAEPAPPPASDPERIGRFRILDRLGEGGMGVVYSAYDPELDRKVALKLLRPDLADDASHGSAGTGRLQREAQAMARLNHPNVVTVHEVGRHDDQVFVAMEFVDGHTLRAWAEQDHDWQTIVAVYCDAAQGLGAAHRAGIVHRDFKPDNVMLGEDGRVRVMDFGLSRAEASQHAEADTAVDTLDPLTRTGAIMGTPAYMAPEQHNAAPTTAASDQFAFCVSLWEALAGERPFPGDTYNALAGAVVTGKIRTPPGTATAPSRIFDALRRGLSVAPADRFDSMEALADTLRVTPYRTARRVGIGVALGTGIAAAFYAGSRPDPVRAGACDDAGSAIETSWSDQRQAAVRDALLQSEAPYAAAAWSGVEQLLGRYADTWVRAAETRCTAALVESADQDLLQRQALCLDSRRSTFEGLVEVLASPDDGVAQQAVLAAATLPPIESCADPRRLEAFSTPRAPEAMDALRGARARLARATAHGGMGHYDRAVELASEVVATGQRYDDPSTEAAGLLVRGQYEERQGNKTAAESSLRDAIRLAEIANDHTTRAVALIRLIYVVGGESARYNEALALGADASTVLRMLGADPLLQAKLDLNLGATNRVARKLDDALRHYQSALATYTELYGDDHPETARALTSLGGLYITRKEPDRAIEVLLRAKQSFETTLGAEHPFIPVVLSNLGTAYKGQHDYARAIEILQAALDLRRRTEGDKRRGVAKTLFNLGATQFEAQRYTAAVASLREGIDILEATPGTSPERLGRYQLLMGTSLLNLGRRSEARATLEPLLDVFPVREGSRGMFARRTRYYLAIALMSEDRARARTLIEVARDIALDDNPKEAALGDAVITLLDVMNLSSSYRTQ
jgi:tetratricopeptide (TPR) repeat protein/predicted Ser/Thr protein kinase